MTRRLAAALALASGLLAPALARAEQPDPFDRAREPRLLSSQRAADAAYDMALDAGALPGRGRSSESKQLLLGARSLLETAGAANHPDPSVRFFYGNVLALLSDDAGTVAVLEPAVAAFADHPDAIEAYYRLAVAYARLQRREDEARSYERYLARQTEPRARASAFYNYGDALMSLGDLTRAVSNYRSAIEIEPGATQTGVLARWGLAVALDRSGDAAQALGMAKEATQLDTNARFLHDENTFFVPTYEIFWYEALWQWARAELANDLSERRNHLQLSSLRWQTYVASAPSTDPWAALAQARFRRTQQLLKAAGGPLSRPPRAAFSKPETAPPR